MSLITDSVSNQDMCICMYAFRGAPQRAKQNDDQLIIQVSISSAAVEKNPARKISPLSHQISSKTFQQRRQSFLSAAPGQRREIIYNIIQGLETPFPLENIIWSLDGTAPAPENLDEIISNRLLKIADLCAKNVDIGCMRIKIRKLEKLESGKYRELCDRVVNKHKRKGPLDDWILENQNDTDFNRYLGFIYELGQESPSDNRFYGLKSGKMETSATCTICIRDIKKGSVAIAMPCSHSFHGFCLIKWLQMKSSCPLCRFELLTTSKQTETID